MFWIKRFFTLLLVTLALNGSAQAHYYIMFSARFPSLSPFSIGGHAFITWRLEDSLANKEEQYTYGFFPKSSGGIFNKTMGSVVEGYIKNSNRERLTRRFIIEVDSVTYSETFEIICTWTTQRYNLFNNNCVDFMNDIAIRLRLKTPRTKAWCIFPRKPQKYIKFLEKLNPERIVKNKYLDNVRLRILKTARIKNDEEYDVTD